MTLTRIKKLQPKDQCILMLKSLVSLPKGFKHIAMKLILANQYMEYPFITQQDKIYVRNIKKVNPDVWVKIKVRKTVVLDLSKEC